MSKNFIVIKKKTIISGLIFGGILLVISIAGLKSMNDMLETSGKNKLLPIYSVETDKKQVALTFDCAWGADDISDIASTLKSNNVKATFFTVGDWIEKHPDEVKLLYNEGMEIRKSHI